MIDEGLTDEWPPEVVEAAKKFQQGDLISEPPLGYAASLRHPVWDLTRQEAATETAPQDAVHLALHPDDLSAYGIITSQTCDAAEDRPQPVQPWVEVSPVYLCAAVDQLPEYLYALDAFEAPQGKRWVADLRLTVSLEKGLLVGRDPIDPFDGSERARITFGVALGERRARAALSESVHVFIDQTLGGHKRKTGKRVRERVYRLLLRISQGSRLDPKAVQLHVVCRESERITQADMEEWFQTWWDEARTVAEEHGVNLLPPVFHECSTMDVVLYDALVPIRCPM